MNPPSIDPYISGEMMFEIIGSGEIVVDIMRALLDIKPIKTHVNHPD